MTWTQGVHLSPSAEVLSAQPLPIQDFPDRTLLGSVGIPIAEIVVWHVLKELGIEWWAYDGKPWRA